MQKFVIPKHTFKKGENSLQLHIPLFSEVHRELRGNVAECGLKHARMQTEQPVSFKSANFHVSKFNYGANFLVSKFSNLCKTKLAI